MNIGDLKKYLANGKRREDMIGVPRTPVAPKQGYDADSEASDEDKKNLAKTFLKVTLAQHDAAYHKGGYHEGDVCNFRESLKRGDSADQLAAAEKKEGEVKTGFVKFKEDPATGKREIVGLEEAEKVKVENEDDKTVVVAGVKDDDGEETSAGESDPIKRYLTSVR